VNATRGDIDDEQREVPDQPADLLHHARTTHTLSRIRPLGGDQLAVPREDRIRSYDRGDLAQGLPAQRLSFGRQSTALVIGKMQSLAARPELFFEDAVLFNQISDHARLVTANPASERSQEELQMDGFNHAASVSNVRQVVALKFDRIFGHYGLRQSRGGSIAYLREGAHCITLSSTVKPLQEAWCLISHPFLKSTKFSSSLKVVSK